MLFLPPFSLLFSFHEYPFASIKMPKTPPSPNSDSFSFSEVLKRLKRLIPKDSLGILGFLFVTVIFFLGCFFFLNYRLMDRRVGVSGTSSQRAIWMGFDGSVEISRVGFLEKGGSDCDLFDGKWVWDEGYPLYQERDCQFVDEGFNCFQNGRPDSFFTKWRWQPKDCNLPRFDAKTMLEKLRNRRVVFVGDSIGRNQWESLLCMLSSAVLNKKSIYEVNGSPITKHNGFLVFRFQDFNCTVEYYRAPFLVLQSRAPAGVPKKVWFTIKLDQMDWSSVHWRDADILIFNTGHWWNNEKTIRGGSYFQIGKDVKMTMNVQNAYLRSIDTLVEWLKREVNTSKTQVFYRTYSPVHFRDGDWRTGGSCHMETLPDLGSSLVPLETFTQVKLVNDVLSEHSKRLDLNLTVLNVTRMSSRRKDGHTSLYYLGPRSPAPLNRQDCSHWCLPGVPDAWNELLYALFLKREATRSHTSTIPSQGLA